MSDYTPGTSEAREQFARGARGGYGGSAEAGAHRRVAAQNEFDRWLAKHDAEVERAAAGPVIADRDAALAVIEKVRALLPGPRTWAESLSRMHDGSMFPQLIDAEKVAAALGLTAGQEGDGMSEATVTFTGEVVTLTYESGKPVTYVGCEFCECQLHDDKPAPRGQYVTIRLDDEDARVWMGPITATGVAR